MPRLLFITTSGLQCSSPPGSHLLRRSSIPSAPFWEPRARTALSSKTRHVRQASTPSRHRACFPPTRDFSAQSSSARSIAPSRFAPSGPMELWRRSKFRRLLDPCSPAATSSNTPLSPSEFLDRPSRSRDRFRASASPMNLAPSALSLQEPSSKTRSAGDSERPAASAFAPSAPIITLLRSSS